MKALISSNKTIRFVGVSLGGIAFAGFLWSRISSGQVSWLNNWGQPVTVFLIVPVLLIIAVIALIDRLVWRKQRLSSRTSEKRRQHHPPPIR